MDTIGHIGTATCTAATGDLVERDHPSWRFAAWVPGRGVDGFCQRAAAMRIQGSGTIAGRSPAVGELAAPPIR